MVVYANFSVSLHRLNLKTTEELEALAARIKSVIEEHAHPAGYSNLLDSDVEVELEESAGKPE